MVLGSDNVGELELDEFLAKVSKIYSEHDTHRSVWDILLHAQHHVAALVQAARMESAKDLLLETAVVAMWIFTLMHRLSHPLDLPEPRSTQPEALVRTGENWGSLIWRSFPGLCARCHSRTGWTDPACQCTAANEEAFESHDICESLERAKQIATERAQQCPKSIDEWERMFGSVFIDLTKHLELREVGARILESLGHASDTMVRMYTFRGEEPPSASTVPARKMKLEDSWAHTLGWLFAFVRRIEAIRGDTRWLREVPESLTMSTIVWKKYGCQDSGSFWCRHCKDMLCTCPILLVPSTISVEDVQRFLV